MAATTYGTAMAPDMTGLREQIRRRYVGPAATPQQSMIAGGAGTASVGSNPSGTPRIPPPAPAPAAPPAYNPPGVAPVARPAAGPPPSYPQWDIFNQSGHSLPGNINFGAGFGGTLNDILRNFLGSGAFSDQPNQALLDAIRSQAEQTAAAQRDHASLLAQSQGLDPATAASLGLRADLGAEGGYANTVNNAVEGELRNKEDFGQTLLKALLGDQGQQNAYNPNKFDWGSIIGKLIPSGGYTIS